MGPAGTSHRAAHAAGRLQGGEGCSRDDEAQQGDSNAPGRRRVVFVIAGAPAPRFCGAEFIILPAAHAVRHQCFGSPHSRSDQPASFRAHAAAGPRPSLFVRSSRRGRRRRRGSRRATSSCWRDRMHQVRAPSRRSHNEGGHDPEHGAATPRRPSQQPAAWSLCRSPRGATWMSSTGMRASLQAQPASLRQKHGCRQHVTCRSSQYYVVKERLGTRSGAG